MKTPKLLAACILLALSNFVHAQWVSIPDTAFGTWLFNNGYSQCLQGDNTLGWQLDIACNDVLQAVKINCTDAGITDLTGIEYFDLDTLVCNSNGLTVINQLPPNLIYLDLSCTTLTGTISSLPALPATLTYLSCAYNMLSSLPALPDSLDFLDCSFNQLTALPALPVEMSEVYFGANLVTAMPALPPGLLYLDASFNHLGSLPVLPATLIYLNCSNCQLSTLPALNTVLQVLLCDDNNLTVLPALSTYLQYLYCRNNQLTALPVLPGYLHFLNCSGNQLTNLPAIPAAMNEMVVSNNPLTTIPALPATKMKSVICDNTSITSFTSLPAHSIDWLSCKSTQLAALPELPDSVGILDLTSSPISCLPELKKVSRLTIAGTNITCLPNYPAMNVYCQPPLNLLQLCNYFNNNGCPVFWNITGKAFNDLNGNCVTDAGESGITNIPAQLWQNGSLLQQTVPSIGFYSFDVTNYGTYQVTIDTANIPFSIKCPAGGYSTSVINAADSMDYNMDFALECKSGFDLEARGAAAMSIFRPANYTTLATTAGDASNFYGGHCAAGVSGTVTLSFTGPVKYVSPAGMVLPTTVTGNTLTWNVPDFGAVNFFNAFDILLQTDTTAQAGQQVCFTLSITTPTSGDNNPANNTFSICYTVVNSYDPNDKAVYPSGNIDTSQRELLYTIRFQNTGNAEAQHIYITDTLSSSINPASFQLVAYSHQPMVQLDGNRLRFNFPNINLPDSTTNEPASHGYVQFKVKLNNGLPVGTVINNTAFIYFDFNTPVVTNTTTNTIYVPAPPAIKPISIGKYRIDRGVKPNGRL